LPHPPHSAAEAGRRGGAQAAGRTALLAAPGPLQAAVGDLARAERRRRAPPAGRAEPLPPWWPPPRRPHHRPPFSTRPTPPAALPTVLFDTARHPAPTAPSPAWSAQPLPGPAKLLGEALLERSTVPNEMLRGARALLRAPRKVASQVREGLVNVGATTLAGISS